MKKIYIALLCVLFVKSVSAQKELLSYNEQNKYIYYQVVEQPGLSADMFDNRAMLFLKKGYPKMSVKQDKESSSISGSGKLMIFTGTLVKNEDGEIDYTVYLEYKDQKYRYWLTDFEFIPYKIDRYGNSVPQQGIYIPLESGTSKLSKDKLDEYLNQTGAFCKTFGNQLKQYMLKLSDTPVKQDQKKAIDTKNW